MARNPISRSTTSIQPAKKRKRTATIEEITFDPAAREDYLTGFHKRKQQRLKEAQHRVIKRAKEDRVRHRKQIRDERAATLKTNLEAAQSMMSAMQPVEDINETSDEGGSDEETKTGTPSKELDGSALGAVKYDDNYIDESLYASVSVQAVEPSKSGILGLQETSYLKERSVSPVEAVDEEQPPDSQPKRAKPSKYSQHAGVEKKNPKKHNKVRYLGAEDRKTARMKEYRPREKKKEVTINSNPKTRTKAKKKKKKTRAS